MDASLACVMVVPMFIAYCPNIYQPTEGAVCPLHYMLCSNQEIPPIRATRSLYSYFITNVCLWIQNELLTSDEKHSQ